MIDFWALVESILIKIEEADTLTDTASATSASSGDEKQQNDLVSFVLSKHADISALWAEKYPGFAVLKPDELKQLAYNAYQSGSRTTADFERYKNFKSIYPLLDLAILLFNEVYKQGAVKDKLKAAESIYNDWKNRVKAQKSPAIPLQYNAISPWPGTVLRKYFSSKEEAGLGAGRIESMNQKLGIYYTIHQLCNIVKTNKQKLGLIPDTWNALRPEKFVDEYLINYRQLMTGGKAVTDKVLDEVYTNIKSQVFNVSKASFAFWRSEVELHLGGQQLNNAKSLLNDQGLYELFISKNSEEAKPFPWADVKEKYKIPTPPSADVKIAGEETPATEEPPAPSAGPTPTPETAPGAAETAPGAGASGTGAPAAETPVTKFETPKPVNPSPAAVALRNTYNLELIQKLAEEGNAQAKDLHDALLDLGSQIATRDPFNYVNFANAAAGVAKALSFGT